MFRITESKGFQITFENGWTVSVQWGAGNYCDNHMKDWNQNKRLGETGSSTAEIAAWDSNGKWFKFEHDTVAGYVTPDKVLEFMQRIASK